MPKSIKMKRGNSNGTLILAIQRGDEINVEYSKKEIIDKINSYFGYKLIDEIKLKIINSENKKIKNNINEENFNKNLEKKINQINNNEIKSSLSRLLKIIKYD